MLKCIFVLCILFFIVNTSKLPSYIIPCSRSQNFDECAMKSGQYAIPYLVKGDKNLKIPSMHPLKLDLVELQGTEGLNLKVTNVKIYGLEKLKILNITTDFTKRKARIISGLKNCTITGDYEINGKLLIFQIIGHGPLSATMHNGIYQYDIEWEFLTRNGTQYINVTKSKYDYILEKITYTFKNLFNGNEQLSNQMNKFLNENWQLVNEDLKAPFLEILLAFHNDVSKKIYSNIPYNELILE